MSATPAQSKRQAYEAEKAALDAVNAPASAYARLDDAFFGSAGQSGSGWFSLLRNPAVALPVAAALGGGIVFAVFEVPVLIPKAIFAFRQERAATETAETQLHAMRANPNADAFGGPGKLECRVSDSKAAGGSGWAYSVKPPLEGAVPCP
jgi:hypothetical protein